MNNEESSPITIYIHNDPREQLIRLRVAALCACLDHGHYKNQQFSEEETASFLSLNPTGAYDEDGDELYALLDPHAFINIPTTGKLRSAEKQLLDALISSIRNNEITPTQLRKDLDDQIDVIETWLKLNDFVDWCDVRSLTVGDLIHAYHDGEDRIIDHTLTSNETKREHFETPYFDVIFTANTKSDLRQKNITLEKYQEVIAENIILKQQANIDYSGDEEELEEAPMQIRERRTLLIIIAALCKEAGYDHTKHAKAASRLKLTTDSMGLTIGESTIESKFKLIADALESRSK